MVFTSTSTFLLICIFVYYSSRGDMLSANRKLRYWKLISKRNGRLKRYRRFASADEYRIRLFTITLSETLCVRKGKKWGAVDKNNNVVVDFVYGKARISNTAELIAFFDYKKGSKMLCKDGNIIDFPKSESVLVFGNYVEYKNKDKKVRIYSDNRRIPDNFITIGADREGILVAKTEKGWSYYNSAKCTPLT